MMVKLESEPVEAWNAKAIEALIDELWSLRKTMLAREKRLRLRLRDVNPTHRPSAINLAHYLALRHVDLRGLQKRLARMGVSSLGRSETHVLANVDKVLGILHRLAGRRWSPLSQDEPTGFVLGTALLARHAEALFGAAPPERDVRIMVTLPSEAATDGKLIDKLVRAGMDIARINCAHDSAAEWVSMIDNVRRSARKLHRPVRVLMDLAGPKLRTGPVTDEPAVLKLKPVRDIFGRVTAPARLGLRASGSTRPVNGTNLCVGVYPNWLRQLKVGDQIDLIDARGSRRRLIVVECQTHGALVECERTAYLISTTCLRLHKRSDVRETLIVDLPTKPGRIYLQRGEILNLLPGGIGHQSVAASTGRRASRASIACTLPEVLVRVRKGERIWFDDGRIGGVVRRAGAKRVELEITEARDGGEHLAADKGINLPDSRLELPALGPKELIDLEVVARHADIVGMSFAQSADDVRALRQRLVELNASHVGLILKIETKHGFEHLPEMILAAMAAPAAGVMIARGDLAVECGYERMAEVQEEILWACEAAHVPVVWATQVLETLAKTGLPSRAEITDAAMGGRAECVMLNKGPHVLEAMRTLSDILRRMQTHQSKKRPLLRALKAWDLPQVAVGKTSAGKCDQKSSSVRASHRRSKRPTRGRSRPSQLDPTSRAHQMSLSR